MEQGKFDGLEKIQETFGLKRDVLEAAKEALVHVFNKYSLPRELVVKTAHSVVASLKNYSAPVREIKQFRDTVVHVVDEEFVDSGYGTDEILQEFEHMLDDRLPSQSPK